MELREVMEQKVFAVLGDTLNPEKYAAQIKTQMISKGYTVYGVGKELGSINDIEEEVDVIDLCINPIKGLKLLKECEKPFKTVVIQPGAESDDIKTFLKEKGYDYTESCLLVGLRIYKKQSRKPVLYEFEDERAHAFRTMRKNENKQ